MASQRASKRGFPNTWLAVNEGDRTIPGFGSV
jgi:hypothetical protein